MRNSAIFYNSISLIAVLALFVCVCIPQQALAGCNICTCRPCYCTYDGQCSGGNRSKYPTDVIGSPQQDPAARQQLQQIVQSDMQKVLSGLADEVGRPVVITGGERMSIVSSPMAAGSPQASTASVGAGAVMGTNIPAPQGFPPELSDRMNQLKMATTISPEKKQAMQDLFNDMKEDYEAAAKIQLPTKPRSNFPGEAGSAGQPGTSAASSSDSVNVAAKRVEAWMKSPEVVQFLNDSDAMLHRQTKLKFFADGSYAREQASRAAAGAAGSGFEQKEPGHEKPAGTPFFGLGGGGPATNQTGREQEWNKPKVQMPAQYHRKPTVPPVPPQKTGAQ